MNTNDEKLDKEVDKFGVEIKIGDEVIFAKGTKQDTNLYIGKIEQIIKSSYDNTYLRIRDNSTNAINRRWAKDIINFSVYKEIFPEHFI